MLNLHAGWGFHFVAFTPLAQGAPGIDVVAAVPRVPSTAQYLPILTNNACTHRQAAFGLAYLCFLECDLISFVFRGHIGYRPGGSMESRV